MWMRSSSACWGNNSVRNHRCARLIEAKKYGEPDFYSFTSSLVGLAISHIWRGYGSAIFLEIGGLRPGRIRRDGSEGNPSGEWTMAIEWSWRIEGKRRIWCGSWSEEERWPRAFARMSGQTVATIGLYGRLHEVEMTLSNGIRILSMMTAEGNPQWCLTRRANEDSISIFARAGRVQTEHASAFRQ